MTTELWSPRMRSQSGPRVVPSNSSTTPSSPPPPEPSGSKRIQSKRAIGIDGARSDRAAGPIFGASPNVDSGAGRPTGRNVVPL